MARGGRIKFEMDFTDFERKLRISLSRVERGTKKATIAACEEIKTMTLKEVPRDYNILASSFFYEVEGKYRNFTANLGYGGKGDPINPRTGQPASQYMVAVHEDLSAKHDQGKAKFLEDPVRQYESRFYSKSAQIIRDELERG